MLKVLLTGATGFVGGHVLNHLVEEKISVHVLGRSAPANWSANNCTIANIDESSSYGDVFCGVDVVVHSAARAHVMIDGGDNPLDEFRRINTLGTLNFAKQAAEAGVKRFVFISSIKVNGEKTLADIPFKSTDPRMPEDAYGQSKAEAEEELLRLASFSLMEVVIIRPPLVYGPGVKANFFSLLKLSSLPIPLPFAGLKNNKRSLVSVFNLTSLVLVCLTHNNAANKVFLVSDGEDISTSQLFQMLKDAFHKKYLSYVVPEFFFRLIGRIIKKDLFVERLCGSLCVDISETKSLLSWEPPISVREGFLITVNHFSSNK